MRQKVKSEDLLDTLREILLNNTQIGTQEELAKVIAATGLQVTQSSISRALRKLGAMKVQTDKQATPIYQLPSQVGQVISPPDAGHLLVSIHYNQAMVVVKTIPGSASLVASILDSACNNNLGCIAGDDTVFITPKDCNKIEEFYHEVKQVLR